MVGGLFLITVLPADGLLRHPGESVLHSAFFNGLITAIMIFFLVPGLAYGIAVGTTRNDKDAVKQMIGSMSHMATYIVLVFFAAQFVYWFGHSKMGLILAVRGAEFLKDIGLDRRPADGRLRVHDRVHQHVHGLGIGQVGDHGAGLRADVHADRATTPG